MKWFIALIVLATSSATLCTGYEAGRFIAMQDAQRHAVASMCGTYVPRQAGDMTFEWRDTSLPEMTKAVSNAARPARSH